MVDISIIEFAVYGLIGYSGLIMLIVSTFSKQEDTSKGRAYKVIYLIPSMFCIMLLGYLGGSTINMPSNTIVDLNSTTVWTEEYQFQIVNTAWPAVHTMFFLVMLVYVIFNVLKIFTEIWEKR